MKVTTEMASARLLAGDSLAEQTVNKLNPRKVPGVRTAGAGGEESTGVGRKPKPAGTFITCAGVSCAENRVALLVINLKTS